jgi:uncharacterized protein YdcH (DUF465 family)
MGQSISNPVAECDAECERQKRIAQLKSNYNISLNDETKDSEEVRNARKQYYNYAYGTNAYDELESKALGKVADAHNKKLQHKHDVLENEIKEQEEIKKNYNLALKNMKQLLNTYNVSNSEIYSKLDGQEERLETAQRAVWYTNQRMDRLGKISDYVNMILNILLVIAIVFFMYDKKYMFLAVVVACAAAISRIPNLKKI